VPEKLVIQPLNRGTNPVRLELWVESGKVVKAKAGTTYYWDFSKILRGKDPLDALQLTQRSGSSDFISHSVAAARALEELAQKQIPENAHLSRSILTAFEMIYGHITHFYQNVLPDYVPFPEHGPFSAGAGDFRVPAGNGDIVVRNVWRAFDIRRSIHQVMALIGGKAPNICAVVCGGVTYTPDVLTLVKINSVLGEIAAFVNNEFTHDLEQVEKAYPEYFITGAGLGTFISVGEFTQKKNRDFLLSAGVGNITGNMTLDMSALSIDCTGSKFEPAGGEGASWAGDFNPSPGKPGGYSWVKGVVYKDKPLETGALARMCLSGRTEVTGLGNRAVSVLGRLRARLEESKILLKYTEEWLGQLNPGNFPAEQVTLPDDGEAFGMAESPQGAVIHYTSIKDGKISRYLVLDASAWNLCPGTRGGQNGPLEQALIGLNVRSGVVPIDILRTARSFI